MSKKIINSSDAPEPIGPYSQSVYAGNTLYISGQIAMNADTGKMEVEYIELETQRVMENIGAILNEAGMDYSHVVKCSIFLKNMDDFVKVNQVYGNFFKEDPPARETVEVSRLPKDVNVEISCIAVK
ncbi:MAG: RidA family protein [Cytophagales bacterium]